MRKSEEVKEVKDVADEMDKSARIAAFFDLDGTLMPLPSLERRFFRMLRKRHEIPLKNYFLWLGEALRVCRENSHVRHKVKRNKRQMDRRNSRRADMGGSQSPGGVGVSGGNGP